MPDNEFRYVLGIQCFANQDSGACIVRFSTDGKILDFIAISEERLIRKKYPKTTKFRPNLGTISFFEYSSKIWIKN